MEAYPHDYVVHNLPLVLLSGLESTTVETSIGEKSQAYLGDGGFRIRADLPPLQHPLKDDLRATLLSYDRSDAPWHSHLSDKTEQAHAFKIRSVGRAYTFPPRKAPPPPHSPRLKPSNDNGLSPPPLTVHSTLSPLSPNSPLYPDGIITPLWITKHQHRLPAVLISFYNLISSATTSSLEDNKIKTEVNNIRSLINATNYKTKFVIVLVADGLINHTELEERLVNIRRGTNFDTKALYYLPSSSTIAEIRDFARVLFSTIYPTAIEYYRDLSKHARRKRNRNAVPQPTVPPTQGTSSILPLQGWHVRYEFKLGIFAETRQELEAASRNYEQAYEGLFHAELFGEAISPRSPRFDEARMLADVIALRLIRCFLWSSQTTNTVKWWSKHRDRIQALIDRRGKGTDNYGWEAWQSTWSKVMAEMVQRSEIFKTAASQLPPGTIMPVQIKPRNTAGSERQSPWENLHHEGYWLALARKHIAARRQHALQLPAVAPDQPARTSPDSPMYDTYLAPEPAQERQLLESNGDGYGRLTETTIDNAIQAFSSRHQTRMIDALKFLRSKEGVHSESWSSATQSLESLWQQTSWRDEGWWLLLARVGELLLHSAAKSEKRELYLQLFWELRGLRQLVLNTPAAPSLVDHVSTAVDLKDTIPAIAVSFAFAAGNGHVGEQVVAQFVVNCPVEGLPFDLSIVEIKIAFDGGINPVMLAHESDTTPSSTCDNTIIQDVSLTETEANTRKTKRLSMAGTSCWSALADLSLSGSQRKVYNLTVVPREAGSAAVTSVVLLLSNGTTELTLNASDFSNQNSVWWETRNSKSTCRDFGMHRDVSTITVLPKPPKLDIKLPDLATAYYANELVRLRIDLCNDEDEVVTGQLEARSISLLQEEIKLRWQHDDTETSMSDEAVLAPIQIDQLEVGATRSYTILISGLLESIDHELELKATYKLRSDFEVALTKQVIVNIPVIRPFEANASFSPRFNEESWPNFFAAPNVAASDEPQGVKQNYLVKADIGCFAQGSLMIRSIQLKARRIVGGAACTASIGRTKAAALDFSDVGIEMQPEKTSIFYFDLELQKLLLGDRSPVAVDFAIDIKWSRPNSDALNTSTLLLPRFLAPMSEPRVLLRASKIDSRPDMYMLVYTLENPSMHFLTFNITMESGDGFAFSGPKMKTISLTPISRYDIPYRLMMIQKRNEWVRINLEVLDAFFGQTLKIQPASDGVRVDKQGNVQVWVDG